jgi:hypothetical protein
MNDWNFQYVGCNISFIAMTIYWEKFILKVIIMYKVRNADSAYKKVIHIF